jgi:hypothetical protein
MRREDGGTGTAAVKEEEQYFCTIAVKEGIK